MAISLRNLSVAQLQRAVAIKEQIEGLESELSRIFGPADTSTPTGLGSGAATSGKRRRTMSAEARAAIGRATKERWAKRRAEKLSNPAAAKLGSGRRSMSPAARKRISSAMKARWAKKRAAKA